MIQLIPQLRILLACNPIDFRNGIDGLAALLVFRNRRGTALKLLCYDGLGYWLITRRFSQGRLRWWPQSADSALHPLAAQQLAVLLYNGLPDQAKFAPAWRALPSAVAQAARGSASSAW